MTTPSPIMHKARSAERSEDGVRRSTITVVDLTVEIHFKPIKNLHLSVYPPDGRVRVAAPLHFDEDAVRLAVAKRLPWVRRQRAELQVAHRLSEREMVTGESYYVWGRRLRLRVVEASGRPKVRIDGNRLALTVRPGTSASERTNLVDRWERRQLRARLQDLIATRASEIGVRVEGFGTRRMRTKWGSYSAKTGRIWINTELAKKSPRCLEYIVVHELCHVLERGHGEAFVALMDQHLPDWRSRHHELNNAPLSAENWPD